MMIMIFMKYEKRKRERANEIIKNIEFNMHIFKLFLF